MCLELTAALFALNTLVSDERGMHAGRNLDNTMTVACINNSGTNYSSRCRSVTKIIWKLCADRNIWMSTAYVPDIESVEANEESR